MNSSERRRVTPEHGLIVRGMHLRVECLCGKPVEGRDKDQWEISLTDLLGLVRRAHYNN